VRLPWAFIHLVPKGKDCEISGGEHDWYNKDDVHSACYHCQVVRKGKLWRSQSQ